MPTLMSGSILRHQSIISIGSGMKKNGQSGTSPTGPKLWVILARAYGALASYVQDRIAAEGLGLSDFMVLEVLLHKGPMSISAIGEKVLLANASMTAAVDRLEEKGLVVRQSSKTDRRSKVVTLTREGRAFISNLYARHARDIDAVTSALSQREQDQLRSLLKKLGLSAKAAASQRAQNAR
jgi:MarR family transcriptional regulator, 2-MHQ and catechol-resistance regulon repressor